MKFFTNTKRATITKNICIDVAANMIGRDDREFERTHHVNHHILLYIKDYIMKKDCKSYFEIGTHYGHSLCTLLQSKYNSKFLSVDLFEWNKTLARIRNKGAKVSVEKSLWVEQLANDNAIKFNKSGHHCKIIKGNSSSTDTYSLVKSYFEKGIDLFFIDGDHHYDPVIKDFELYFPLVNKNGFIVFDDYLPLIRKGKERECPKAIDFLVEKHCDKINVIGQIKDRVNANKYSDRDWKKNSTFIIQKK